MDLDRAEQLALDELARAQRLHLKLAEWRFAWNDRKGAYGLCRFGKKTIELSRPLTALETDDRAVLDTIRHELAHALAGPAARHGPEWKQWAALLGCRPRAERRFSLEAPSLPGAYALIAVIDGEERVVKHYHRRPPRAFVASLPARYIRGRPETRGTLRVARVGSTG